MLYITFGTLDKLIEDGNKMIVNVDGWFKFSFKPEWLQDDYVRYMVKMIDKSEIISPYCIMSPVFGQISPDRLSSGVKALILLYNIDSMIWAGTMGDNCFPFVIEMSKHKDIHLGVEHTIYFNGYNPIWENRELFSDEERNSLKSQMPTEMEAIITNTGKHIYTIREYMSYYTSCKYDKDFPWLSTEEQREQDEYIARMRDLGVDEDEW